jgi:dihydroorotase
VELFSTAPARILKLNAGTLKPGAPADLTILDTERVWTFDVNQSLSKSRNSPFHNQEFRGGPVATIVNGAFVWRLD